MPTTPDKWIIQKIIDTAKAGVDANPCLIQPNKILVALLIISFQFALTVLPFYTTHGFFCLRIMFLVAAKMPKCNPNLLLSTISVID